LQIKRCHQSKIHVRSLFDDEVDRDPCPPFSEFSEEAINEIDFAMHFDCGIDGRSSRRICAQAPEARGERLA
jgi:hypothetical protein